MGKQQGLAESAASGAAERQSPIDFAAAWPSVRAKLMRVLCARQVPRCDAEDIVQEVAARALSRAGGFDSAEGLAKWGWRVAWNLRIDAVRRERRIDAGEAREVASPDDTARLVEGRLAVASVLSALTELAPSDRVALFAASEPDATRKDDVRQAVRRHRARARLLRITGGAVELGVTVAALLRRLRPRARTALVAATPVVLLAAMQVGPLAPGSGAGPSRDLHPAPQRGSVAAASHERVGQSRVERPTGAASGSTSTPASARVKTIAVVPVGTQSRLRVTEEPRRAPPTACLDNIGPIGHLCVDRPGPGLNVPVPEGG